MLGASPSHAADIAAAARSGRHGYAGVALARSRLCEALASRAFGVDVRDLRAPVRCRQRVSRARQIAVYLAHVSFGVSYKEAAQAFGRDPSTVRHACTRIEDARDDADFDHTLLRLEQAARAFDHAFGRLALEAL